MWNNMIILGSACISKSFSVVGIYQENKKIDAEDPTSTLYSLLLHLLCPCPTRGSKPKRQA